LLDSLRLRALAAVMLVALVVGAVQPPAPTAAAEPVVDPVVDPIAVTEPTPTGAPAPDPAPASTPAPDAAAAPTPAPAAAPAAAPAPAARRAPVAVAADRVIRIAMAERGSRWVYGASGPSVFDCSGLVLYAFRRAGELDAVGNGRFRSGSAMLRWARARGLTGTAGRRGDIAVWGNGAHVGIYLGNGRAISTLVSGVRVHGLRALTTRFTTFIHTGLSGTSTGSGMARATAARATTRALPKVVARRTVATRALNLRVAPSPTAVVARVLERGTRLGVVRSAKDATGRTWYRVVAGSRVGWVAGWLTSASR
jgi:cell wall-associated NlpC family hydrolase